MSVDVEGRFDRFLQQPLGRLSLVESGAVLLEVQTRDGPQSIEGRRDPLVLPADDRRIDGAHAMPSRARNTWITLLHTMQNIKDTRSSLRDDVRNILYSTAYLRRGIPLI